MATAHDPDVMTINKSSSFSDERQIRYHEMKKSSSLTDCVISIGEKEPSIKCHRMVLSAASPYVNNMFSCEMKESLSGCVKLDELNSSAVTDLIDYCYLGELDVPWNSVVDYLKAAHHLQLIELMPYFDNFITKRITPNNCVGYLYVAGLYGLSAAKKRAEKVITDKLSEVSKLEEFSQLNFDEIMDVVEKSMERKVQCEDVLQACVNWVLAEEEDRKKHFAEFLFQIKQYWRIPIYVKSLLDPQSKTLLSDMSLYQQINIALQEHRHKNIMILGGRDNNNKPVNIAWKLNVDTGKCETVMNYTYRYYSAVCVTSLGVLVAGGGTKWDPESTVNECDLLELETLKWRKMPATPTKIYGSGAVSVEEQVFVMGGGLGREKTMECFDLIERKWSACRNLLHGVRFPIVCAVGQIIYVVFNSDPNNKDIRPDTSITLQCYDVISGKWSYGPALPDSVSDTHASCAASQGHRFFVVGGRQKLCLCYDTQQNCWITLQGPSQRHGYGSAVFSGDKLVVLGGTDCGEKLDSIESFDVKREEWKVSPYKLPVPMLVLFCFVID